MIACLPATKSRRQDVSKLWLATQEHFTRLCGSKGIDDQLQATNALLGQDQASTGTHCRPGPQLPHPPVAFGLPARSKGQGLILAEQHIAACSWSTIPLLPHSLVKCSWAANHHNVLRRPGASISPRRRPARFQRCTSATVSPLCSLVHFCACSVCWRLPSSLMEVPWQWHLCRLQSLWLEDGGWRPIRGRSRQNSRKETSTPPTHPGSHNKDTRSTNGRRGERASDLASEGFPRVSAAVLVLALALQGEWRGRLVHGVGASPFSRLLEEAARVPSAPGLATRR